MMHSRIVSIQVGLPQTRGIEDADDPMDHVWTSAIFKAPVDGPVWLGALNLEGDRQADQEHHGGIDQAVLAYSADHYDYWREALPSLEWIHGGFGENFTISSMTEADVAIGDIYTIGDARVQVTQPRQPCWKLARRWRQKDLTARVQERGYTGWYLRVLQEGYVEAGMSLELRERQFAEWTVARVSRIVNDMAANLDAVTELAACPALSDRWRKALSARAEELSRRM